MKYALFLFLLLSIPLATIAEDKAETIRFSDVASKLVYVEFEQNGEPEKALGAIARIESKPYLIMSQHVLLGTEKLRFITASGVKLSPRSVELSNSSDLARLALPEDTDSFELEAEKVKMATAISVIKGGSDTENRVDSGKVIGIGGLKFEISTMFDEKSNGAPVLTDAGKLAGLSSHSRESMRHAMKKGTRFDEAKRHFCYRIKDTGWQHVNWGKYNRTFGKPYQDHKALADRILRILKDHDNRINRKEASELSTASRTHARQINLLLEKKGMTGYLTGELESYCELFDYAEELFGDYAAGY